MNDWSDYASARLRKQQQDRHVKSQDFRKTETQEGPWNPLWHQVIRAIVKEMQRPKMPSKEKRFYRLKLRKIQR